MVNSIRARLQIWYSLVLIAVVSGFAGILYYRASASAFREIDKQLEAAAAYLDVTLRTVPPFELDSDIPERPEKLPKKRPLKSSEFDDKWGDKDFPPPKKGPGKESPNRPREVYMADLDLPAEMRLAGNSAEKPYFVVWRWDGSVVKSSDLPEGASWPELDPAVDPDRPQLVSYENAHEVGMRGPHRTRILVGRSIVPQKMELQSFAWQLAAVGVGVLAFGLAGGWLICTRIFRPISAMSEAASTISATNLGTRIDTRHIDRELADLAQVLNTTFDRLQEAFERQARFTADASHELRTPLAIIRSNAQLALDRPRSEEDYRQTVEACLRSAERMTTIVAGLLALARADAGWPRKEQPLDFAALVEEAVAHIQPLATSKGIAISADLEPVTILGDPAGLNQLVGNLLSNAIQYNRPNGTLKVGVKIEENEAVLTVSDTGEGIPEADRPFIFERFYRVDKARSRASGGTGLGLAICKGIVEAHGGTIGFDSTEGEGTTFWVRLPIAECN